MKIGIIGGGITGIAIGQSLIKKGYEVIIFEREREGGLAGGFSFPYGENIYLDKYYHHIFQNDQSIIQLINEYGLLQDLLWLESKTGIYAKGRCWNFQTPLDLLRFSPIGSIWQRFLMGLNIQYFRKSISWEHLDGVSCRQYFDYRNNGEAYRNLWEPLLKQKFADSYWNIPASFLWGRIHPRSRSRKNSKEYLGYLKGGFHRLIMAMATYIQHKGGQINTNEEVRQIILKEKPLIVTDCREVPVDLVVWTINLEVMPDIIPGLPCEVRHKVKELKNISVSCLILVLNQKQSDYYWLNNIDPDISFGLMIEHTNLISPYYYFNKHILYLANYHNCESELSGYNVAEMLRYHMPSLKNIFPNFSSDNIEYKFLFRNRYSSPIYSMHYSRRIPPYREWLEKVHICNMAQIYPEDRNMNNCVKNALSYTASM